MSKTKDNQYSILIWSKYKNQRSLDILRHYGEDYINSQGENSTLMNTYFSNSRITKSTLLKNQSSKVMDGNQRLL